MKKKIRVFKSPCCKDCGKVIKRVTSLRCISCAKKGKNNPMFGKKPPNYNGGFSYRKSGSRKVCYRTIAVNGKNVVEHRYLMEKKLGRKLKKSEEVHHIDGNGMNNNLDNLIIMTHKQHQILHECWKRFEGGGAK